MELKIDETTLHTCLALDLAWLQILRRLRKDFLKIL